MVRFVNAALSGFAAWQLFLRLGLSPVAAFVCFVVLFVILSIVTGGFIGGIWNSGLWTTMPVRLVIGLIAEAVLWGLSLYVASLIVAALDIWGRVYRYEQVSINDKTPGIWAGIAWFWRSGSSALSP